MHAHDSSNDSGIAKGLVVGVILALAVGVILLFLVFGSNVFGPRGAAPAQPAQQQSTKPSDSAAPAQPAPEQSAKPSDSAPIQINPSIQINPPASSPQP